jgi:cell division protein FtsB
MGKIGGRRRIKILPIILSFYLIFTLLCCGTQFVKLQEMKNKQEYYAGIYQDLQAKNAELVATKDLLGDDTYMERLARERFKLIKPNEYLVVPAETNDSVEDYVQVKESEVH